MASTLALWLVSVSAGLMAVSGVPGLFLSGRSLAGQRIAAALAVLVLARNRVLFILGWEIMALSSFFLVATEDHEEGARQASWIYLFSTHVATLCLYALFALLHRLTGSLDMRAWGDGEIGPA